MKQSSFHVLAMIARAVPLVLAFAVLTFCSSSTSKLPPGFGLDQASTGSGLVTPAGGGIVQTKTGDTLVVPPGAVAAPLTITMIPVVLASSGRLDLFGAVAFQPDAL